MRKYLLKTIYILLFAGFITIFSISCSRSEPQIVFGFIKLVLYQSEDKPQEQFSFFIIPEDEDGFENLNELYLYHDKEQLCWQIKSDDWLRYTYDGKDWIGTRSITINEGSLPRGVFRAVLVNKGGEKTERNFTYDGSVRFPFPELEINNGTYTINSRWPSNKLVCYDSAGNYVNTYSISSHSGSISQLKLASNAKTAALWAEDESNYCSAFTEVVPIN